MLPCTARVRNTAIRRYPTNVLVAAAIQLLGL